MASFDICMDWVLPHEAGSPPKYAVTHDNKGDVCAGVNSLAYPRDFAFLAALPEADRLGAVAAFYQREFWNQWMGQIQSNAVAAYLLDCCINQGPGTGVKILQTALGACGQPVKPDGCLGPASLTAVNLIPPAALKGPFQNARIVAYSRIGGPNLSGWLKRASLWPPFE